MEKVLNPIVKPMTTGEKYYKLVKTTSKNMFIRILIRTEMSGNLSLDDAIDNIIWKVKQEKAVDKKLKKQNNGNKI